MSWPDRPLTVEEYLEVEKISPVRHEFVNGWAYELASETITHNRIARQIATFLDETLPAESDYVFALQTWLKVSSSQYYYPDVVVVNKHSRHYQQAAENPLLIAEVLSPSTDRIDCTEKREAYRQITGLLEYVLVAQDQIRVTVYRQPKAGEFWQREIYTHLDQTISLASVGKTLSLAQIYGGIQLDQNLEGEKSQ